MEQGHALEDDATRQRTWRRILRDIETIVTACHEVSEDITVVIAGYDYLDYRAAERFWKFDFHGIGNAALNGWLKELGDQKRALAKRTPHCVYVSNWGALQRAFGTAGEEGPAYGMPAAITPDGIHPSAEAHARLLRHAIDAVYKEALAPKESAP